MPLISSHFLSFITRAQREAEGGERGGVIGRTECFAWKEDFFFFNWSKIALQNFAVFCQTSTWISHRCPLPVEPPSYLPPHPTPLGWSRAPVWVSWDIQQIPFGYLFTYGNVSFHVTLPIHLTLSFPLPMSVSLFSLSVSLSCLLIHFWCLENFMMLLPSLLDPWNYSPRILARNKKLSILHMMLR